MDCADGALAAKWTRLTRASEIAVVWFSGRKVQKSRVLG